MNQLNLEQVRVKVVGQQSDEASKVLKSNGFRYAYTAYPVVVWWRGSQEIELHYQRGRVSQVVEVGVPSQVR